MRLLRVIFRRNGKVYAATTKPVATSTPITQVRRKYLLLGKEYAVKIEQGERNSLKIEEDSFRLTLAEMTRENFETFMENWYRRTARTIFLKSIQQYDMQGFVPQIKVYKMKRAWGRCYYQKGIITFNLHLVKTPQECIDYIVLHELCHFTHHNHSKDFKDLVASIDPAWKSKDQLLKEFCQSRASLLQRLHI